MSIRKISLLVFPLTFGVVISSHAVAPGPYIQLQGGLSKTTLKSSIPSSAKSQIGGGFQLGARANEYFAVELGYTHFANANTNFVPSCGSSVIHTDALGLAGKGIFPWGPFGVFAKGGVAAVRNSGGGFCGSNTGRTTTSARALVGLGGMFDFNQNWVGELSWTRLLVNSNVKYSDLIALGVSYHFVDKYCGQFLC